MKNDLTCGVVQDLLPSYVEGLLGEESRQAVDRHLEDCPECTARKDAMSAPAEREEGAAKEVDYLKRVKKQNRKRILVSVIATVIGLLGALLLKIFVIGTPLQPQSVAVEAEIREGNVLHLSVNAFGSGDAFHGWRVETVDGAASVYARRVLVSPMYQDGEYSVEVPLEGVREVWLGGTSGMLVWQDGVVISRDCLNLLELRTPYCGDTAALGQIAQALQLPENLGNYTVELQTSSRPYGWTLVVDDFSSLDNRRLNFIIRCEYLMLALVDNLDFVCLRDGGDESANMQQMPLESANQLLAEMTRVYNKNHQTDWTAETSVKDYANSHAAFQRLMSILDYYFLMDGMNAG